MTWPELGDIFNKECRGEDEDFRHESAYRKMYQYSKTFWDKVFSQWPQQTEGVSDDQDKLDQLYMAKKEMYDQRREYNKLLTIAARSNHLEEELIKAARELPSLKNESCCHPVALTKDSEAVLFLSDWHFGSVSDNVWNVFNQDVFEARIKKLVEDASTYLTRHAVQKLHIVILGDMIEGVLRPSSQIEASELGVNQLMKVTEVLAQVIAELSRFAKNTLIYTTYGNHARTVQNYVDSIHADNLETLIPWWLKLRFEKMDNIEFINSMHEFVRVSVCGYELGAVHGDLDTKNNLARVTSAVFNKLFHVFPSYVCMGHVHHNSGMDDMGVETMTVGSLSGTDSYANGKRLYATPSQTLLMFNKVDGKECRYDIKFK